MSVPSDKASEPAVMCDIAVDDPRNPSMLK